MNVSFEPAEAPCPRGGVQPKLERIDHEEPRRFFLVGKLVSGEPVRIRLCAVRYEQRPEQ